MIVRSRTRTSQFSTRILLAAAGLAGMVSAQAFGGEYIVKFKDSQAALSAASAKRVGRALVLDTHTSQNLLKVEISAKSKLEESQALAELMRRDDVEYVTENFKLNAFAQPNDPRYSEQWSLAKVRAAQAWDVSRGSRAVTVAVIDTGVDLSHVDLKANAWTNKAETAGNGVDDDGNGYVDDMNGYDFKDNDANPNDETSAQNPGHGTHCAGIVGAVGDNSQGISGMTQQVSIMALRFIGPNGQGDLMGAIKAVDYAIAAKADVISASWGAKVAASQATPLIEAVGRASAAGVIFVAAAANDGANNDSTDMYPANSDFPNVIAVAASDVNDAKPQWSNFGKAKVHLSSPGADILSTVPNGNYSKLSGTSMATPLVAGLVALLKSRDNLRAAPLAGFELKALLQTTGSKVAIETACMCRVDAASAMEALETDRLLVVPAAATIAPNGSAKFSALGGAGGYQYRSNNASIVEVAADGTATAKAVGETTVTVTDSAGKTADSLVIRVAEPSSGGGGGGGECPLGDQALCDIMCQVMPELPWCAK